MKKKSYIELVISKRNKLFIAVRDGNLETCKELIKDVNINTASDIGYTALHYAVQRNKIEICKFLLDNKANINAKAKYSGGEVPLHLAYYKNNVDVINLLLENGADPTIKDNGGLIPVQWESLHADYAVDLTGLLGE